jgi:hypothetical protein
MIRPPNICISALNCILCCKDYCTILSLYRLGHIGIIQIYIHLLHNKRTVPEFIDPVFVKTSPKRSFSITENERFGLVFVKTGSINSSTGEYMNTCKFVVKTTIWIGF